MAYESKFQTEGQVVDGVFNPKDYYQSKVKLAFFLKEPYSSEMTSWHIRNLYDPNDPYDFFRTESRTTWHPIIYITYAIRNGFINWNSMEYIRDDHTMCHTVSSIAFINANKSFSKTGSYTLWQNLEEGFHLSWPIIDAQIDALTPDVFIFGSTFSLYSKKLSLEADKHYRGVSGECQLWEKDGKLFIDAYHPSARGNRELYANSIITAVKEWAIRNGVG